MHSGPARRVCMDLKLVNREILLSFWKVHVLHHAAEGEVIGNWMLEELRVAVFAQQLGAAKGTSVQRVAKAIAAFGG